MLLPCSIRRMKEDNYYVNRLKMKLHSYKVHIYNKVDWMSVVLHSDTLYIINYIHIKEISIWCNTNLSRKRYTKCLFHENLIYSSTESD